MRTPLFLLFLCTVLSAAEIPLVSHGPLTGALTDTQATVVAKLLRPYQPDVKLEVSEAVDFSASKTYAAAAAVPENLPEIVRFELNDLRPLTRYHYRVVNDAGVHGRARGEFVTFPREGSPATFRFAFSSCASTASQSPVFAQIRVQNPLFYLNTGDFHYEDIKANERDAFRATYDRVLASPQGELLKRVNFVYMWDDHDYGPNGSDRHSPSRQASHTTYREYVPHYPLASAPHPDGPISQAFSVGRARFILLDTRTERDAENLPDGPKKTMLGAWQKEWFKQELLAANGVFPLIFVVSSVAWISNDTDRRDNWGRYATERAELSNWMVENNIKGVCFLSGDAHMLAADDGSHNNYARDGGPGFPALQAAPLDRSGSIKGGPWSVAPVLPADGEGQFGFVEIDDYGARIEVVFRGLNDKGTEKLRYAFTVPATAPSEALGARACANCPPDESTLHGVPLRGVVLGAADGTVVLEHPDLPGVLRAGTTVLRADAALIEKLTPTTEIFGRIERRAGEWWLFGVRMLTFAPAQPAR